MAVSILIDSYVTVEEANAHLEARLGHDSWKAATVADREMALRSAASKLDEMTWGGTAVGDAQTMAFPRVMEYFDPRLGGLVYLDGSVVPSRIQLAQIELASHLMDNPDALLQTDSLRNLTVGPIAMIGLSGAPVIPSHVKGMITPLLQGGGQSSWWRAN